MRAIKIKLYFLLPSLLGLCTAMPASAAPVQATEPALHAGSPPPAVNVQRFADAPSWRVFTPGEGGFSVLLPSSPTVETRVSFVSKETLRLFHCYTKHESYIVQYADKEPKGVQILGPEKILSILDGAMIKANRGSLISRRHFMLGKYPGREIVTKRPSGNIETQRVYLVANRLYILTATHFPTQTENSPTNSDKFLDSFTLLPAEMPNRK